MALTSASRACIVSAEARCGGLQRAAFDGAGAFPEPGAPAVYAPDRGFEIAEIRLDLTVAPSSGDLAGIAEIDVRPLPGGLGEVVLDLDDVALDGVEAADGTALKHRYGDGQLRVSGLPAEGGTVRVRYHGRPVRGMYFTGPTPAHPDRLPMAWTQCQDEDGHFIFPCLDRPGVKHPWRITVRVDADDAEGWTVVGNGRLAQRDGSAWTWVEDNPMPAYLVTVVVGKLAVIEDTPAGDVPIRYLVPAVDVDGQPADEAVIRRIFGRTPEMVRFLAQRLDTPYPWPRYDQVIVHDFIFGGMENAGATTLTDVMLTDDRAALDVEHDDLVVHELMHQWFGDLVTCQDWSQGWLNEGWATYSEQLWKAHAQGVDEEDLHAWRDLGAYLTEHNGRYRRAMVSYRFREPIDVFDRHLYQKGGLVLRTLRHELGEDAFWAGVAAYLRDNAYQPVHTRDFQRSMEHASGRNLDGFFRQYVLGAGHPKVTVKLSHADGLLQIKVTQTQTAGPVADDPEQVVAEAFSFTLPVVVVVDGEAKLWRLPVRQRTTGFSVPCATAPDRVEVDGHLAVLADIKLEAPRDWLITNLVSDEGVVARLRAAAALAEEGSPKALAALAQALVDEKVWGVRGAIARLLGKHGGETARRALLGALTETHPRVRRAVVESLAQVQHPDVARALVTLARKGDASYLVEGSALVAVGSLVARADVADPAVGAGIDPDDAVALLREALHRPSWTDLLVQRALEGLARTRRAEVLDVLVEHTSAAYADRVRAAAANGLGRLAGDVADVRRPAVDCLIELARSSSWRVRYFAIMALGGSRDPRALGPLGDVHRTALEGRLRRTAWESSRRLSKASADPVASLRDQLDSLRNESRTLRERVDELEGRVSPQSDDDASAAEVPGESPSS